MASHKLLMLFVTDTEKTACGNGFQKKMRRRLCQERLRDSGKGGLVGKGHHMFLFVRHVVGFLDAFENEIKVPFGIAL